MARTKVSFQTWLDRTFGRAVTGDWFPQFVQDDEWPDLVPDHLAMEYLATLFEVSEEYLRYYSDRQIACGLWELGPGEAHCVYNRSIPVERRERLVASVADFFRDFFDRRCLPKLSHLDKDRTEPLNAICYMWWEVISWGWPSDDPDAERLGARHLDVMEAVLRLSNPACKKSAIHGLGHMARGNGRARSIIEQFLAEEGVMSPGLERYAKAALTGCIP